MQPRWHVPLAGKAELQSELLMADDAGKPTDAIAETLQLPGGADVTGVFEPCCAACSTEMFPAVSHIRKDFICIATSALDVLASGSLTLEAQECTVAASISAAARFAEKRVAAWDKLTAVSCCVT